jgi:hypothetical protein
MNKKYEAQGTVSPVTSSSSNHTEESDNHLEYYVKGGENMSDNNIGVTSAPDRSYDAGPSTTEPDPKSEVAMQKDGVDNTMQLCNCMGMSKCVGCACAGCQTCDGCDGDDCQGCSCDHGVTKAACNCCDNCGSDCSGDCCDNCSVTTKAVEDEDIQKSSTSLWGGAFAPGLPTAALRTVFRQE